MKTEDRNAYQIFTTGFCGAESLQDECKEQQHRLGKVEALIPYLKEMNINTILFGPLFQSMSHGYDTIDYRKVDRRLGTNEELRELVDHLHAEGFEVVLDCVFNHVGRDHFAVQDLLKNRENARYKDWFCNVNFSGNNAYNDGLLYDNWAGCQELVKLNLWNPEVRDYLKENLKFWIETFDIDGVRMDAANVMAPEFLAELSDYAKSLKDGFFLFGEIVGGDYGNFIRQGHLDSCTNYECYKGLYSSLNDKNYFEIAHSIRRLMDNGGLAQGYPLSNFVDNHDVNRVASTLRDEHLLIPLYTLLYTMPGYPTVYYGSEQGIKGEKGQGTDAPLRPPFEAMHFDPENQLYRYIGKLGAARKASRVLREGRYHERFIRPEMYGFSKDLDGEEVFIVLNMNENEQSAPMDLHGDFVDILTGKTLSLDGDVPMAPYSGRILFAAGSEPELDLGDKPEEPETDTVPEAETEEDQNQDHQNEEIQNEENQMQEQESKKQAPEVLTVERPGEPALEIIENLPTGAEERAEVGDSDDEGDDGDDDPDEPDAPEATEPVVQAYAAASDGLVSETAPETDAQETEDKPDAPFAPNMHRMMEEALLEAREAAMEGEVPVGAVVVKDGEIIARAHNRKEALSDPTAHAEILALREAAAKLSDWRLPGCELYVTAEPCPMCMGAVMQTRLDKLVYGTPEMRYGAVENNERLMNHEMTPRHLEIYGGVREDECRTLLTQFFEDKKEKKDR